MNKICIDARFWGIKHTGIGRYVENLIDNLPSDPNIKVVLIVHPEVKDEPKLVRFDKYYARHHPYSFTSQLEMLWLLARIKPSLTHFTHFSWPILWPGKFVVTIHDLIKHSWTDLSATTRNPVVYLAKRMGYRITVWVGVKRAAKVIVPAKYWKEDLVRRYYLDPSKVEVTYEGVDRVFILGRSFKVSPLKSVPKPFVVYTGNLYPHKNVPILIEACEELKIGLAIVCARDVFAERLPKSKSVHFLGRLTDEELVGLYRQAEAFVFPSLIEGFGLPGLEAMAAGLPVIAARASCLPEIYGDAALYFDPYYATDLADKIEQLLTDAQLRRSLIATGHTQVAKYSWAKMATQTWQIYQNALL